MKKLLKVLFFIIILLSFNSKIKAFHWAVDGDTCTSYNYDCNLTISNNSIPGDHLDSGEFRTFYKSTIPWKTYIKSIKSVKVGGENDILKPSSTDYWFYGMFGLTELDLSYLDTSSTNSMGYMFDGCSRLTKLDLRHFDTSFVSSMTEMFYGCSKLQIIAVSDKWTVANVGNNSSLMFGNCEQLIGMNGNRFNSYYDDKKYAKIDMPDDKGYFWNFMPDDIYWAIDEIDNTGTYKLYIKNSIENNHLDSGKLPIIYNGNSLPWLSYRENIVEVEIGEENDIVKPVSTALWFSNMVNLKKIDLTYLDTSIVLDTKYMFAACSNLQTIKVSDKFVTSNVKTSEGMFHKCSKLVGVNGTSYDANNTDITYAKKDEEDSPGYFWDTLYNKMYWAVDGNECNKDNSKCELIISNNEINGNHFASGLFDMYETPWRDYAKNIINVRIGGENDIIRPYSTAYWFIEMSNLRHLDLTYLDTTRVSNMSYMFSGCNQLQVIKVSNYFDTSKVSNSESMFHGCKEILGKNGTKFTYLDKTYAKLDEEDSPGYFWDILPDNIYWAVDGEDCTSSENDCELLISANQIEGSHVDSGDFKITSESRVPWITYKDSISDVSFGNADDLIKPFSTANWFSNMPKLKEIDLSYLDTSNDINMNYMFNASSNLSIIKTSNKFTISSVKKSDSMFSNCTKLIGMNGTTYNSNIVDKTYARIDEDEAPGYFWNTIPSKMYWAVDGNDCTTSESNCSLIISNNQIEGNHIDSGEFKVTSRSSVPWFSYNKGINSVNIGNANDIIKPYSTAYWFYGMNKLEEVNLAYLNTSKLKNTSSMFNGDYNLKIIKATNEFNSSNIKVSDNMFYDCTQLFGMNGTTYDSNIVDKTYAKLDEKNSPGFFWNKPYEKIYWAVKGQFCEELSAKCKLIVSNYNIAGENYEEGTIDINNIYEVPWQNYKNNITSVEIGKENDVISPYSTANWFRNMSNLETIDLSYLDTSKTSKMGAMFWGCSKLKTLDLSLFDTSRVTSTDFMFYNCFQLKVVKVSDKFTTSSIKVSNDMFSGCTNIIGMNDTKYNSEKVDIEYAKIDDSNNIGYFWTYIPNQLYYSIDIVNGNKYKLTISNNEIEGSHLSTHPFMVNESPWAYYSQNIIDVQLGNENDILRPISLEGWFNNFSSIDEIDLSYIDTSNVIDMSYLFYNCTNLKNFDVSNFDTSKVVDMSNMFNGINISTIDLSNFDTSNVKNMNSMFANSKLFRIKVSDSWNTDRVIDSADMFLNCYELIGMFGTTYQSTMLDKSYAIVDSEEHLGYLWNKDSNEDMLFWKLSGSGCAGNGECILRITNELDTNDIYKVGLIRNDYNYVPPWYTYNYYVTSVFVGEEDSIVKPKIMNGWFKNSSKLQNINLEYLDTSNVTDMQYLFNGCNELSEIDVSNFDTSKLTNMSNMFSSCRKLVQLDLSSFDTSSVTNMTQMFYYDDLLETIKVSDSWNTDNVSNSDQMFNYCSSLVGMNGTTYGSVKTDKEYARVDTEETPGYFWNYIDLINISFEEKNIIINKDDSKKLKIIYTPSIVNNKTVSFESSNPEIATIDSNGIITAISKGNAIITATSYNGKTDTCEVTVKEPKVLGITTDKDNYSINYNVGTFNINYNVETQDYPEYIVEFISSDTDIISVNDTGKVTINNPGEASITIKAGGVEKIVTISIYSNINSVSLNKKNISLNIENSEKLTVTISPNNTTDNKNLTWESSNESIAIVSNEGMVTAVSRGTATITVTTTNGKTDTCEVTVKDPKILSINVDKDNYIKNVSDESFTINYEVIVQDDYNYSVEFYSSDETIATVNNTGKVTFIKPGKVIITIKADNIEKDITINLYSNIEELLLNKTALTLNRGEEETLIVSIVPEFTNTENVLSWSSSNEKVATVDSNGNIKAVDFGETIILVISPNGKYATCNVSVSSYITNIELKATENNNSILLEWPEDVNVDSYDIYRSEDKKKWKIIKTTENNSYTDKKLTYGKTYYYRIKAKNKFKTSEYSSVIKKKIVPNKVINFKVKSAGTNNIKLSWDKVSVTGYELQSSTDGKKWSNLTTITKSGTLEFNNKKLKANKKYYYRIRAYKTVSKKKIYGSWSSVISTKTAPKKPSLKLSMKDLNVINITIGASKGSSKYIVEKSLDGTTYELLEELTKEGTLLNSELTTGVKYYYRVKACNSNNNCSGWVSANLVSITKTPSLKLESTKTKKVSVTVGSVNGASGYEVYRSTSKKGKYSLVKELNSEDSLTFNNGTKKGVTYYYKVRAYILVDGKKKYTSYSKIKNIKSK